MFHCLFENLCVIFSPDLNTVSVFFFVFVLVRKEICVYVCVSVCLFICLFVCLLACFFSFVCA